MENVIDTKTIPVEPIVTIPQTSVEKKLIVGVIPMKDRMFLDMAWAIIKPHVIELSNSSLNEYDESRVYLEVLDGYSTLFMFYLDDTPGVTLNNLQQVFITKHLETSTPEKDFVGYVVVKYDMLGKSMHTWQAYVRDEYRNNKQIL